MGSNFALADGDADEARDLVQETFLKSLKASRRFAKAQIFALDVRILRNTFLTSRTGLERRNTQREDEEGLAEFPSARNAGGPLSARDRIGAGSDRGSSSGVS
jgi:DNA-directed RNA polymerase specialized sigma24 family protein